MQRLSGYVGVLCWAVMSASLLWIMTSTVRAAEAPAIIRDIRFMGNEVTQTRTLLQEFAFRPGDVADPQAVEQARQALMDLGLFQKVNVTVIPVAGGVDIEFRLLEKRYLFLIPRLDHQADGDISYGLELQVDNLWGLNQSAEATLKWEPSPDQEEGKLRSVELEHSYPHIAGTPYGLDTAISLTTHPTTEPETATATEHKAMFWSALLSRWLAKQASHGWRLAGGLVWRSEEKHHNDDPATELRDVSSVGLMIKTDYRKVHDYLYSVAGVAYGYSMEIGAPMFNNQYDYFRHDFYYRRYIPLGYAHRTLSLQVRLGLSNGHPYGDPDLNYTLGSATTLRGYIGDTIVGKSYLLLNVEYATPLFQFRQWRGVIFGDLGNAYEKNMYIDPFDLKAAIGVGFRFRPKAFVNVQLRIDSGYAIEDKTYKTYVGTRATF